MEESNIIARKSKYKLWDILIPTVIVFIIATVLTIMQKSLLISLIAYGINLIPFIYVLIVVAYPKIIITYDSDGLYINTIFLRNRLVKYEEILEVTIFTKYGLIWINTPTKKYKARFLDNEREIKGKIDELIDIYTERFDDENDK